MHSTHRYGFSLERANLILQVDAASVGLNLAQWTIIVLFDSVVGVRTNGRIEISALKQETRMNEKIDAFRAEAASSLKEAKDQIKELYNILSKRRKVDNINPANN